MTDKLYITATEYALPNGDKSLREFEVSQQVWDKAQEIFDCELRFEFEILNTGEAHFTITDDDEDVSACLSPNDASLIPSIEACILAFDLDEYLSDSQAEDDYDEDDDADEDDDDKDPADNDNEVEDKKED